MKKVAGQLRLDLAQYRELEAFAKFSSDLDPVTKQKIERGKRLTEILKQTNNNPMPISEQIAILYAAISGRLDELPVEKIKEFEESLLQTLKTQKSEILKTILAKGELSSTIQKQLDQIIEETKLIFTNGDQQRDKKKS